MPPANHGPPAPDGRKLYQQVADAVADDITRGRYKVGDRLPSERDLADELKVSRPTVREAMIALEILGLVAARAGSGVYVVASPSSGAAPPELDVGAFELTEARLLFEGEAAALAASSITDEQLADLAKALEDMVEENDRRIPGELADRRFHLLIAQASRNSAVVAAVECLWDLRQKSPLCAEMLRRARQFGVQPRIDDHRELLHALQARDPKWARRAMREHLGRVIENLLVSTETDALARARQEAEARRDALARRVTL